ncbi:MAG: T9SS type A sorting domain-containing protein, partial [Bacteroidota bacterium]
VSNVSGAMSYTWTNPAGTTISSGQGSTTILLIVGSTFNTGQLTVTANTTLCTPGISMPRTISIDGKPNTPGSITANPTSWCNGASVNFSITPVSPLPNYNWFVSQGTMTAGQTTNNIDVTWGTGTGNVNVTAGNTCGASGTRSQSFSGTVCREEGYQSVAGNLQLTVYPNPAHDKVTVSLYVNKETHLNILLSDISGRVILTEGHEITEGINAYDLDLKNFAKGVYLLEIQSATESIKTKVVVE